MATWSRADETYPAKGAWAGQPIEAMARDVRVGLRQGGGGRGGQDGDSGRRGVDARDPDRRRRSESVRRHRGRQAQSLDLRQLSRQHARLLPRGAGDLRQRDRTRSALARRERVLGVRARPVAHRGQGAAAGRLRSARQQRRRHRRAAAAGLGEARHAATLHARDARTKRPRAWRAPRRRMAAISSALD